MNELPALPDSGRSPLNKPIRGQFAPRSDLLHVAGASSRRDGVCKGLSKESTVMAWH